MDKNWLGVAWGMRLVSYLSGIHHRSHADSEGHLWHLVDVPSKEAGVCLDGVHSQRLDSGTRVEGGAWLVEGYVTIRTNA